MTRKYKIDGVTHTMKADEESARDAEEKEWADGEVARNAIAEIQRLEATITPRRIRDALANDAGKKWVADVEALIATERGKL
jgi:hypothetical protein